MLKRNIVYVEIPTKDSKKSGDFYGKLFGWHITHDEKMDYTMWDPHEGITGGFTTAGQDTQVGEVLLYINSEDIEADLKQAATLGATIVKKKTEIPETGWYGIFKDPTGNNIGLLTLLGPAGQ
jgi:predicted enzyme related to lactoylglutathione lyase